MWSANISGISRGKLMEMGAFSRLDFSPTGAIGFRAETNLFQSNIFIGVKLVKVILEFFNESEPSQLECRTAMT
ncbi:hypothetical protein EUGRSUZ_B03183 [Eucalyptus grandis]|uniref:Uncharacterized protein n=2 Tax=Eucalyptus grandis TaxID=71139 RepID=A0ACC3LWU2_EUCGR|nr:hypothetical protein EUGRSUZ_B03183 [Eucalyptus grandis]